VFVADVCREAEPRSGEEKGPAGAARDARNGRAAATARLARPEAAHEHDLGGSEAPKGENPKRLALQSRERDTEITGHGGWYVSLSVKAHKPRTARPAAAPRPQGETSDEAAAASHGESLVGVGTSSGASTVDR
jgi:hypothetical protein